MQMHFLTPTLALVLSGLAAAGTPAAQTDGVPNAPEALPAATVAVIGKHAPVTYSDLQDAAAGPLLEQQYDYDTQRAQLEASYARARQALLERELGKLVDERVLELESKARNQSPGALLGRIEVPPVTDSDVRAFYESRRNQTTETFEKLQGDIRTHLQDQKKEAATTAYYASLRSKYGAQLSLEPLRSSVSTEGPFRGPPDAPVTIVEFADFQCPYCRSLEPVLAQLLQQHPRDVRLVYRQLPLTEIHPEAMHAAESAVCAEEQGKFWQMHDAIFGDAQPLSTGRLRTLAEQLGLNSDEFEACVRGTQTGLKIHKDLTAARKLAIDGTPALFINGRYLQGSVQLETLTEIVNDELQRAHQPQTVSQRSATADAGTAASRSAR